MTLARWVARAWAAVLFVIWGAFFVEHLEWFNGQGAWPPASVAFLQAAHLLLLIGLVIGWKWETAGGVVTLSSAIVFFLGAAGARAIPFVFVTAVPAVIWITIGWWRHAPRLRAG